MARPPRKRARRAIMSNDEEHEHSIIHHNHRKGDENAHQNLSTTNNNPQLTLIAKTDKTCANEVADNFCTRCSAINFRAIYAMDSKKISSQGEFVFDLGWVDMSTNRRDDCGFCQMVVRILLNNRTVVKQSCADRRGDDMTIHCHLKVFSFVSALGLARTASRLALRPSLVVTVVPVPSLSAASVGDEEDDDDGGDDDNGRDHGNGLLARNASLASGFILPTVDIAFDGGGNDTPIPRKLTYVGRAIAYDKINYEVLRGWLLDCRDGHTGCMKESKGVKGRSNLSGKAPPLVVIDCETRILTRLSTGATYIALSYVWGANNGVWVQQVVEEGQELPYPQSRTIEDTLQVVRELGQKYLWLDRYSINQGNEHAKQQAILVMADIFEKALLTIVALGPDVNSGLYGLSSTPRNKQPTVNMGDLWLVSSGRAFEDVLIDSAWSKRGWTLQEALLSCRMLVFSQDQVYWKCVSLTARECTQQPGVEDASRRRPGASFDPDIFSEAKQYRKRFGEMPLPLYLRQVAEYTKRDLTYDSDALNAFRALLIRSKERTFYGVPVFLTRDTADAIPILSDSGFVLGLLWSRRAHQWYKPWQEFGRDRGLKSEIRKGFPSWSWTSTCHCVQFDPISFDRNLSNKSGRLHACAYQHSSYVLPYVNISILDHGSVVKALEEADLSLKSILGQDKTLESLLPASLQIHGIIAAWKLKTIQLQNSLFSHQVVFDFPSALILRPEQDWLRQGTLYLDNDRDEDSLPTEGQSGTALLLLRYRRYGYHLQNVVWWMAIYPSNGVWRRFGLIRSVHLVGQPVYPAKDRTDIDRAHRRPFLPASHQDSQPQANPPDRDELESFFTTVTLV